MFSIQPEVRYSASVCSAGTRTTSSRSAWAPPSLTPSTACAVLSSAKPSGAVKVKPSLRMQEAAAAHEAFARVLAVDDAVDAGEIGGLVALAARRAARELARVGERVADALRRRRMRRQEVRRARIDGGAALLRLELGIAAPSR